MNKKISILLKILNDLNLEKVATPLADVYDMGEEARGYRYRKELTGKKSKDYFEYSKKIKDNFAVYYINEDILNLFESEGGSYHIFNDPESLGSKLKIIVENNDDYKNKLPYIRQIDEIIRFLKNSKKYKYNIIVNSQEEYGDSYTPQWFIHDIIGHTFSILSKEKPGENENLSSSIFGREKNLDVAFLFRTNNNENYSILSFILNQMNIPFNQEMFYKISSDYSIYNNFFEKNISYIYLRLEQIILRIHDDIASKKITEFLKKIDAEIHSEYILDQSTRLIDSFSVTDILPSLIVSYIQNKDHTINMMTEYMSNKNDFYSTNEFYNKIVQEFNSEKENIIYNIEPNDYQLSRLLVHMDILDKNIFDFGQFKDLFRAELDEHFSDVINSEKFKKTILRTFLLRNNSDKIMENFIDRFKRVDAALERVSNKYIVCNMTQF